MKCYICGCSVHSNRDFYAVDPPGTPDRRWACEEHINQGQIPRDVKQLVDDIHDAIEEAKRDDNS